MLLVRALFASSFSFATQGKTKEQAQCRPTARTNSLVFWLACPLSLSPATSRSRLSTPPWRCRCSSPRLVAIFSAISLPLGDTTVDNIEAMPETVNPDRKHPRKAHVKPLEYIGKKTQTGPVTSMPSALARVPARRVAAAAAVPRPRRAAAGSVTTRAVLTPSPPPPPPPSSKEIDKLNRPLYFRTRPSRTLSRPTFPRRSSSSSTRSKTHGPTRSGAA